MKRICVLIALLLCVMLVFCAQAENGSLVTKSNKTAYPGDTVEIQIYAESGSQLGSAKIKADYDEKVFEFTTSFSSYGQANPTKPVMALMSAYGIPDGSIGSFTFKI